MMIPLKHQLNQPRLDNAGPSMRSDAPLGSFLGNLFESVSAKYQQTCTNPKGPPRLSFVIVTDNARIHPKHTCLCLLQKIDTSTSIPRASSCPGNLDALCCLQRTNMSSTVAAMTRVASTGNLCRWGANICGLVDKKSDGAARPPTRTWSLDQEEFSDHYTASIDDDDDFGSFVLLGDDNDGNDELPTTQGTSHVLSWKSFSVSSPTTSMACH
jgi:hypothetical protein